MKRIDFKNDKTTPITADVLNELQDNVEEAIDETHEVGTTYLSDTDPSTIFGGTWEKVKTFTGGELLAYGWAYNNSSNNTQMNQNEDLAFSDNKIPNKNASITDYIGNLLTFDSGTFKINTQNLVGMVEAVYTVSGNFAGNGALWYKGNHNALPTGISIHNDGTGPIMSGVNGTYGGNSRTYYYKVDEDITENLNFYVNPIATIYNSSFTPCGGGVKCELLVKVYAKKQLTYVWQRTA